MFGRNMTYALQCSKCHQYCKTPTFKPQSLPLTEYICNVKKTKQMNSLKNS